MKARPILFSGAMVRALLDGRKTQTRRVVKDENVIAMGDIADEHCRFLCPYGKAGDLLWVRESVRGIEKCNTMDAVHYIADGADIGIEPTVEAAEKWMDLHHHKGKRGAVVPSIFMPKWASRLTLEITDIRVERLQDISEKDKQAEGQLPDTPFGTVWKKINTKQGVRWDDNPWVWVIEFKVHHKNVLEMMGFEQTAFEERFFAKQALTAAMQKVMGDDA